MSKVILLVPAYKPTQILFDLAKELSASDIISEIIIIDDGCGTSFKDLFVIISSVPKVTVLTHAANMGKGRSIKTGVNYIVNMFDDYEAIITADADGQHKTADIILLAQRSIKTTDHDLILGCRTFDKNVPARSQIGNALTRKIFKFLIGLDIKDTQTGLRSVPRKNLIRLLQVEGERYEYETHMLLEAKTDNWKIEQIDIQTVYIENNKSSHFNPITDSMKIYFLIFRFLGSSILSSSLDFSLFAFFTYLKMPVMTSVLSARFISGWVNFYLNRQHVFKNKKHILRPLVRYWSLVFFMGLLSSTLISALENIIPHVLIAKILVESILFIGSFSIQKEFIFSKEKNKGPL